ncbi:sensor histidine kinase [Streptomyces sp. NPDC127033]|uniref:sensor histidine kinase n=1 Tax=Streptomyces sp. NPDC127033 TaxID=3347110 RepID=UPI0036625FEC
MTQLPEALIWCLAVGTAAAAGLAPMLYRVRHQVQALRDQVERQAQSATADRHVAHQERDAAQQERDTAHEELDAARAGRDAAQADRDLAYTERDTVQAERDAARVECEAVGAERDALRAERDEADRERERSAGYAQALEDETRHLVTARLPAMATHLENRFVTVPGPLKSEFSETGPGADHASVLDHLATVVAMERRRVDEAAQATMRGATTVMQAMSYQLQSRIVGMQEKYNDPGLADDLLALDELNEQNLRRIQATGVLCGAWPGLSRADSHLGDVVAGAKSRVRGYHRVKVTSQLADPVAVVSRAVEPIAITVTELLANAVHHSHGTLSVDVSLHQSASGAVVVIDDAGVGMHQDEIDYATRMLSGQETARLAELGDPPRAGFAAIGRLTRQYGFSVSVDKPAPYGGVRAVVFIPGDLLTLLDESQYPMSASAPLSPVPTAPSSIAALPVREPRTTTSGAGSRGPSAPSDAPAAVIPDADGSGTRSEDAGPAEQTAPAAPVDLPRRRRKHPATSVAQTDADDAGGEERSPEQTGATWSSFQLGTASGREAVTIAEAADGDSADAPAASDDVPTASFEGEST